jgi:hypothetical protein
VGTVNVDKRVFVGLAAVAGVALLAVAFLLGRASSGTRPDGPPPDPSSERNVITARAPVDPAPLLPARSSPAEILPGADAPSAFAPDPAAPQSPAPEAPLPQVPLAAATPLGPAPDPERAAVAAYLEALDGTRPAALEGDAESVANGMAVALANGDASGLERLARETEDARRRLASVVPPPSCTAHHRETLGSLDDALEMLRSVKEAMASPEPATALLAVAAKATALRTRAESLDREDRALRARYGLAR